MSPRRLAIGCGHDARPDWINLDVAALPGVDVVHDLNVEPWPLADASMDHVECLDVLEHLDDFPGAMRELHRIIAPGGTARITGPHFTSYAWCTDPTHRRAFAINTFDFFTDKSVLRRDYYFDFAFAGVSERTIRFQKVFWQPWNWLIEPLVNLHRRVQAAYEATFLSRLFPAHYVEIVLTR